MGYGDDLESESDALAALQAAEVDRRLRYPDPLPAPAPQRHGRRLLSTRRCPDPRERPPRARKAVVPRQKYDREEIVDLSGEGGDAGQAMIAIVVMLLGAFRSALHGRTDLLIENLAPRQQLAYFARGGRRPRVAISDRLFWTVLQRCWSWWSDVLVFVKPETVIRWHRAGFRRYWTWLSRRHRPGRPSLDPSIQDLIRRLARENPTWGAPRVHGELRMLGLDVSERTVSRYMPRRSPSPDAIRRWLVFLRNHREAIAAMDFFVVPTATFRLLYVWFAIDHVRRRILHFEVTDHPGGAWVVQQLREAFPFDALPRHLIFDRDSIFSAVVVASVKSLDIEPARTAYRCPWQNGIAERWVNSVRRELLNHVIVFGECHLRRFVHEYVAYYHTDRTHLGLGKATPSSRSVERRPDVGAEVVALARVGGLHHRYTWRAAA